MSTGIRPLNAIGTASVSSILNNDSTTNNSSQVSGGGFLRRLLPASPPSSLSASAASSIPPAEAMTAVPPQVSLQPPPSPRRVASPAAVPPAAVPPARRKRQATTAACGACRKRKSKCNGDRPRCSVCRDRGTDCEYDTNVTETHTQALKRKFVELQTQKSTYEKIYDALQSRPERVASDVFRRIRGGADVNAILRHVTFGDVVAQTALVPETRLRYQFPFLAEMPTYLMTDNNPYLESDVYEFRLRQPPASKELQRQQTPRLTGSPAPSSGSNPEAELQPDPYFKPFHAATIAHPWLDSVTPSRWTSVSSDDSLMRTLLNLYILHEYDWFTSFHKDYFLSDMVNGRPRFCSELLVNAVLCMGCFCYKGFPNRFEHWNPKNLGYQFFAEAKRLFELELELEKPDVPPNDVDAAHEYKQWELRRLVAIQAALILNLIYDCNGSDKIGWRFTIQAEQMAREIRLFNKPPPDIAPEEECVRDFTAWAFFNWQSLNSFHYFKVPIVKAPPESPLPNPSENPNWYGETWVMYPLTPTPFPIRHPQLFKAKSDLWAIVNTYCLFAFSRPNPKQPLPASEVLWFYKRLMAWFDALPESLSPQKIVTPHQIMLHMQFNLIILGILKPIHSYNWSDGSEISKAQTPHDAYLTAYIRFETTVRLYYLRHGFSAFDSFIINFCGSLGQMATDAMAGHQPGGTSLGSLRSTILLAAKGLYDQSQCDYIAKVVFRLQLSSMRPEDVDYLKRFAKIEPEEDLEGPLKHPVKSEWPTYARAFHETPQTIEAMMKTLSLGSSASPSPSN